MEAQKTGNKNQGRQVKRFRESIGMKQATLAEALGTTQQNISNYEKQEELEEDIFNKLAIAMGVNPEILKDFNSEAPIFSINEMREHSQAIYNYNFNPIEKIVEQADQIKELYEELLKSEREKVEVLREALRATQGK